MLNQFLLERNDGIVRSQFLGSGIEFRVGKGKQFREDIWPENQPRNRKTKARTRPGSTSAGMGEMRAIPSRPAECRDKIHAAVTNRQKLRQLNAEDVVSSADGVVPGENVPIDKRAIKGKSRYHKD